MTSRSSSSPSTELHRQCDDKNNKRRSKISFLSSYLWKKKKIPKSLTSAKRLRKKRRVGDADTRDTKSYPPRREKLPNEVGTKISNNAEISTKEIFTNMFMGYRLQHPTRKPKQIQRTKNERTQSDRRRPRDESITRQKKDKNYVDYTPQSFNPKQHQIDDSNSLALSEVSSITMPEINRESHNTACRNPRYLFEWIAESVFCIDRERWGVCSS